MADKPKSESPATVPQGAVAKPAEPPKPVHIGGESLVDRILPHMAHEAPQPAPAHSPELRPTSLR